MEERDVPPGIGALDFVEESSRETKAIWQQYRTFRRGIITLEALETQLGATLLELSEDSTGTTPGQVEIVFLTQSLRALQETSEQALNSIIAIENGTVAPLLDDGAAFVDALERRVPDLSEETKAGVKLFLQRYGNPRKWLQLVREVLSAKQDFYRSAGLAVQRNRTASRASIARQIEEMALSHQTALPEFPPPVVRPDSRMSREELPELIEQAIERGRERLNNGAPSFLAGAWYHRLANQITWHDPEQAAGFGTFVAPTKPQPIIICFFAAGPGIAICVIVALVAISSHNVETDDDGGDTDGGDDDGGTTGD
jgi:hypothetical protein